MSKDVSNSSPPARLEEAPAGPPEKPGFRMPRPADVPGSTPPPMRKSMPPPDGARGSNPPPAMDEARERMGSLSEGRTSGVVSGAPRSGSDPGLAAIPKAPGVPRVAAPPRPAAGGPPRPAARASLRPEAPKKAADAPPPSSAVVVTPMRIIEVAGPAPSSATARAPTPAPAGVPPLPGSEWPTPLEVPAARLVPPRQEEEDDDEEAVPLRRVSSPPPPPEALQAQAAAPAPAVMEVPVAPSAEAIPPTHPSAAPRPKPPLPPAADSSAASVEVEVEVAPDSDPQLESLDDADLTEVKSSESQRRKLPPPPPMRTSFGEGAEDTKRKPWWEEMFQEDYERSTPELTPEQLEAEVYFIESMLGVNRGGAILDLACGEGRYAVALAQRGYTTVGLDCSTAMLTRASSRSRALHQPVEFVLGDMRELAYDQQFDAVLCWNASFGYFEKEKNQAVLSGVFQALKPGGTFLLDIPNRDFVVGQEPAQNWFEADGCVCMDDMRLDFITSRLLVKRTIMLDDGRNRECHYSIRLFSLHELGRLLHDTGFRVIQLSGAVSTPGVFFGSTSPRMIVLVTKP